MSRQADFSRVIWSAMVSEVNPGSRFANSTILMMHFVESSLNLSHKPRSSWTRWSELEFWKHTGGFVRLLRWRAGPFASEAREPGPRSAISILHQSRLYVASITQTHRWLSGELNYLNSVEKARVKIASLNVIWGV